MKKNQKLPCLGMARSSRTVGVHLPSCGKRTAFLLSSPHSGRDYPRDFLEMAVLPMAELKRMEDRFTDQLLQHMPSRGLSVVQALFPRSVCDVNRDWRELDANMFSPPLIENDLVLSAKVNAGYGVIPRCTSPGKSIYRYCLPTEEAGRRLSRYWEPYHDALQQTQQALHQQFGMSVLLDIHSMPPLAQSRRCDIVLGNRHGKTCSDELITLAETLFTGRGYHVQRNTPYSGGYITGRYGRLEDNRQSLQIEINRACYLNMQTLRPGREFATVQKDLTEILSSMAHSLTPS